MRSILFSALRITACGEVASRPCAPARLTRADDCHIIEYSMNTQSIQPSESLQVIAQLARANALLMRRFESGLPGGLGFNDFMILLHLHQSAEGKMRRTDLADRLG